jgi:hypothetical protein
VRESGEEKKRSGRDYYETTTEKKNSRMAVRAQGNTIRNINITEAQKKHTHTKTQTQKQTNAAKGWNDKYVRAHLQEEILEVLQFPVLEFVACDGASDDEGDALGLQFHLGDDGRVD